VCVIVGKYIKFRSLEETDLKTLEKWRNSKNIRRATREYKLLNMINQRTWFESIHIKNPPTDIMFGVLNKKNILIGVTGITYIDWKNRHAEVSIYLSSKSWQKTKEAEDAIKLVKKYAFEELNLHRLWVEIFENIPENIKLFKKLKFNEEGILKDKLWRDGRWWNSTILSTLSS
jgi:RimJ/RimL family protein N-acetyltransferase